MPDKAQEAEARERLHRRILLAVVLGAAAVALGREVDPGLWHPPTPPPAVVVLPPLPEPAAEVAPPEPAPEPVARPDMRMPTRPHVRIADPHYPPPVRRYRVRIEIPAPPEERALALEDTGRFTPVPAAPDPAEGAFPFPSWKPTDTAPSVYYDRPAGLRLLGASPAPGGGGISIPEPAPSALLALGVAALAALRRRAS